MKRSGFIVFALFSAFILISQKVFSENRLNESYIIQTPKSFLEDSSKVDYIKYNFYSDGTGEELRVEISKSNDSLSLRQQRCPLTWSLDDSQRLTVETMLDSNIKLFRQYDMVYGGTYLENVNPEMSILYPVAFNFIQCSTDFLDPDSVKSMADISNIYEILISQSDESFISSGKSIWPWKFKNEPNWYEGVFRIDRFINNDNNRRIIISKNGICFTLVSPPNRPHTHASKLYSSWECLKNMKVGDSVYLSLDLVFPFIDEWNGTRKPSYRNATYESSALNGIAEPERILVCGNLAAGLFYGIVEQK